MVKCIRNMKFVLWTSLIIGIYGSVCAGGITPAEELANYRTKYPGESSIILEERETITYQLVGDSIVTTIDVYKEMFHIGENGPFYSSDDIYFSASNGVSDIVAYTLIPGKKKYSKIEVTEFDESYDTESSVFYDDNKQISFNFPAVQTGTKTVIQFKRQVNNARLINPYFFDTYLPLEKSVYTVIHEDRITLKTQYFNGAEEIITEEQLVNDNGQKVVRFTAKELDKIHYASNGPNYRYLSSGVYCPIASYTSEKGKTIDFLADIHSLYDWYQTLISDIQSKDEGVKRLVDTIIQESDTDLEKVEKIYLWVQENVKYIAFEDGMRGFIPHPGSYVMEKRYGDCKDMSSLIVSMLREANIDARYTWIGSRKIPYTYSEVPSPITDNHMIASYEREGRTYFLDATGAYTPFGMPTSMIQGKEALVSLGPDEFRIVKVPIILKEQNVMADSMTVRLENGKVIGEGTVDLSGYAKVFNSYKLVKSNQKKIDDYVNRLLSKGSNKFGIDKYEIAKLDDLSVPTQIKYWFKIPDYYRQIGDDIYINLVLDKTMTDALLEDRKVPLENDYKYINNNVVKMIIPEGFNVSSVPENSSNQNENFGYEIKYQVSDTEIIISKQFYLDYLMMMPEDFDDWNLLISEYASNCRKALILSKNTN